MKRLSIVFTCDSEPIGLYEIERRLRTAGFTRPQAATTTPNSGSAANHTNRRPRSPYAGHARSSASAAGSPTSTTGSTATSCRASGAAADTGSNDDPRKEIL